MDPNFIKPTRGRPRTKKNNEQEIINLKKMLSPSSIDLNNDVDLNSLINTMDTKKDFEPFFSEQQSKPYRNIAPSTYSSIDYVFNNLDNSINKLRQPYFYKETPEMIFNKKVNEMGRMPSYNPKPVHYTPINNKDIYQHTVLPIILSMTNEELLGNEEQHKQFIYTGRLFLHKVSRTNFEQITVSNLKMLMREFGLNHTGKKLELIDRLLDTRTQVIEKFKEMGICQQMSK